KSAFSPRDRAPVVPPLTRSWSRRARIGAGLITVLVLTVLTWVSHGRLFPPSAAPPAAPAGSTPVDPTEVRLREAVAQRPRDAAAHAALGGYFLSQARPVSALWELEAARSLQPRDDPTLRREQARALESMGRLELATDALRAVLASHPGENGARAQLAEVLLAV